MEAGVLCRFLSRVPVSPVQKTGLPLLKSILPGAHIQLPEAVLPAIPLVTGLLPVIIPAANLIPLNTGLHPAAIRVQAAPTHPAGHIPAAVPLPREDLLFPEGAVGRPVQE